MHSFVKWAHNFGIVQNLENITMIDLAISQVWDPDSNIPEKIVQGFSGTGIPVQVRCDPNDTQFIDTLLESNVKVILSLWWDEDPVKRKHAYEDIKRRWENLRRGK